MPKQQIFIVEDDENISELLSVSLEAFDYKVEVFDRGSTMLETLAKQLPKLIILDIMLPGGMSGIDILKTLKSSSRTKDLPIIMLSAKSAEFDKINALELGADDYVTKPFSALELSSRIKSVIRRTYGEEEEVILEYKDIKIDKENYTVTVADEEVNLTRKEYEILKLLIENLSRVVTREELLNKVWGYDFMGESRTLDMHIKTLRNKLSDDPNKDKYIKTIRGVGYKVN